MAVTELDRLCINTIRMLSLDMVQAAKSGHPGMPLGASPVIYTIFDRFLKFHPASPCWHDRDRYVLSAGHACAMLYSTLHLYGYDLPLEDLKNFRKLGSKCPGHPEAGMTPGVEATAGPLGQGISNAVGMALAEAHLAAYFNRPGLDIVDHYTYVMCSDGDLMEGVSSEASSLAGFLGLGKLVVIYDDNGISIEGATHDLAYKEDTGKRYEAYGWQVLKVADVNDLDALSAAIRQAQAEKNRPTLIWTHSIIGEGSPEAGSAKVHGEPMKDEAARKTKERYGWPLDKPFHIPAEALAHFREALVRGKAAEDAWKKKFAAYAGKYPDLAKRYEMMMSGALPEGWEKKLPVFKPEDGEVATRNASGKVLNAIAEAFEGYLVGGSADLAPSTKTIMDKMPHIGPGRFGGMNVHFGVREHAMGAVLNGMALHGGMIPYGATFLVFSDYMRPTIRLAAITELPVKYVFTHDSIGVGEDGPTHQPVEHIAALRLIPNMMVIRPADANETAAAWKAALEHTDGPVALILSRQNLPVLDPKKYPIAEGVGRGAYILSEAPGGKPKALLLSNGSEVQLALQAQEKLAAEGIPARVVSFPCWELFERQTQEYQDQVLPPSITARVLIKAGVAFGWEKYVGWDGDLVTQEVYGKSGHYRDVIPHFGFTVENIVEKTRAVLRNNKYGMAR